MGVARTLQTTAIVAIWLLDAALLGWGVARASIPLVALWAVVTPLACIAMHAVDDDVVPREKTFTRRDPLE